MDSLTGLLAFVRAAEHGSFVAAGRAIGISASAVGKNIARLERGMGVRLFHRSTRHIRLTEEGAAFHERCKRILDELEDAQSMLAQSRGRPRGRLRISLPIIGYRFVVPVLPEFCARYPEIELDLDFNDHLVDVIEQGLDAVIRSGDLPDSRLMARRLGPFRFVLAASPDYLAHRGVPRKPSDLQQHACLRFRFPSSGRLQDWAMRAEPGTGPVDPPASLTSNNMEGLLALATSGMGIAYMPDFLARDAVADGRLQCVLDDWLQQHGQFWVLWPSSRQLSPKLRAFVDFVGERLFKD